MKVLGLPRRRSQIFFLMLAIGSIAGGFFARPADTGGVALRDFEAYYSAGATWRYHGDPYSRDIWRTERTLPGVVATRDELLPFVGPPFGLPLWGAISQLPWSSAVLVWRCAMSLSFAAIVLASIRLATGRTRAIEVLAALVAGGSFGPLTSGVALGQVAVPACAAIVTMPFALRVRLAYVSGFGAALAALQPNLAVVLALRFREPRTWIAFCGALALAAGGSAVALLNLGGIAHYLEVLRDHADAERNIAIQTSAGAVMRGLGTSAEAAGYAAFGLTIVAIALLALQAFSKRYTPNDLLAIGCAALPLAVPFAHEHDFNVAFFPALLLASRARGKAWYVAAAAAVAVSVDWLGLVQRPTGALEEVCFAFAAASALLVLKPHRTRAAIVFPALAATTVALAAAASAHHVLPTWPAALPADFHMPRTASAAMVWGAEQRASGIAALDPFWSALRLVSLAGCAALWAVASYVFRRPVTASGRSEPLSTSLRPRAEVYPSA